MSDYPTNSNHVFINKYLQWPLYSIILYPCHHWPYIPVELDKQKTRKLWKIKEEFQCPRKVKQEIRPVPSNSILPILASYLRDRKTNKYLSEVTLPQKATLLPILVFPAESS